MKHSPFKKIFLSVLCFVISFSLLPLHTAAAADTSVSITGDAVYQYAWDVLDRINAERTANGLSPVEMDAVLLDAAMQRALECAVYYDHTRPDGSDCFSVCSWRGWVGENIAVGYGSPDAVMDGWMNSQGHRENILRSVFTSVGVGVFMYNGTLFWAQIFDAGTPRSVDKSNQTQTITQTVPLSQSYVSLFTSQETSVSLTAEKTFQIASIRNRNAGWSYTYINVAAEDLSYTSADTSVATVSASGIISPVGNGSTTISVFLPGCEDKSLEYTVTVQGMDTASTATINGETFKYIPGQEISLTTAPAYTERGWGYRFAGWTGDTDVIADAGSSTTTITMPERDIVIDAEYLLIGDANQDGQLTLEDALYISQMAVGTRTEISEGDIDDDGLISVLDITYMRWYLVGNYIPTK